MPEVKPSWLTRQSVYSLAESVRKQLGYEPGDELGPVVKKLGGRCKYKDFWSEESDSGSLKVTGPKDFVIYLSSDTTPERDRFTIAHELGHYVLHFLWPRHNGEDLSKVYANRYGSDRAEWEANWFAAAFLMPEAEFRKAFQSSRGDYGAMARRFGVSKPAAQTRAKALGLSGDDV